MKAPIAAKGEIAVSKGSTEVLGRHAEQTDSSAGAAAWTVV